MSDLINLTIGEKLLVDRRRRSENQRQAAERLGMGTWDYTMVERDKRSAAPSAIGKIRLGRLKPHEKCLLYRRRSGTTQAKVARDLGVCRWWVNQMERGDKPCDQLLWYWEQ